MKLYKNLCEAVVQGLEQIFVYDKYADKVIEKILKSNPKWGGRDRRFIAETIYDIVRWYRLFKELTHADPKDFWTLLGVWCVWSEINLPPWREFEKIDIAKINKRYQELQSQRPIIESIPDWLDELGEKELGPQWEKELHALNMEAKVVLRVNTLKTERKKLQEHLSDTENILTTAPSRFPDALLLEERQNIFTRQSFKDGLFEMQDAGSQLIAPFTQVEPGMRVVDACAGAGGKTLHLASLMQNKGRIIAMDTEAWKLDELKKRARRAGANNIETRVIESSKTIKRLEKTADRLLLDVPCSGLGVIKRNPDAKWKLSPASMEEVKQQQQKILNEYSQMLKPGGKMVYATCSLLPSENEKQVKQFIMSHQNEFILLDENHIFPSEGYDGFYMALLERK